MSRRALYSDDLFPRVVGYADDALEVRECPTAEADAVIAAHHYSHKPTPNRFLSLSVNGGLGYMQLGYGIRPHMKHTISRAITKDNYCEFDRMWLSDDLPKNSESRAIGLLMAYLRAAHPRIKYVITYADESVGNRGTIYMATNARPAGAVPVDFYVLPSGERIHPVSMYHRHGHRRWAELQKLYPGIKHVRGGFKQRRFVYAMDRYARRALEAVAVVVVALALAGCAASRSGGGERVATGPAREQARRGGAVAPLAVSPAAAPADSLMNGAGERVPAVAPVHGSVARTDARLAPASTNGGGRDSVSMSVGLRGTDGSDLATSGRGPATLATASSPADSITLRWTAPRWGTRGCGPDTRDTLYSPLRCDVLRLKGQAAAWRPGCEASVPCWDSVRTQTTPDTVARVWAMPGAACSTRVEAGWEYVVVPRFGRCWSRIVR